MQTALAILLGRGPNMNVNVCEKEIQMDVIDNVDVSLL